MSRESWSTRGAFVLAAIGSAVGLGNLWGFPYKVYSYGGGAFLVPYFIAMVVMGIPLLIMEFSVGHWAQKAPPDAFAKVMKKYRFVGWWLVLLAFVIITYYTVILGYCVDYLVQSVQGLFGQSLPWEGSSDAAGNFFANTVAATESGSMVLGAPVLRTVVAMLISWFLIYICLCRGVKWVSKVVLITVPLPWIMLLVLTVRGLTLDGAMRGLEFYLEPTWGVLLKAETWRFAFGQVFFSMSLGFAVMMSYASFLHKKSDLNNNALIIGLGDLGTSFVAGIAVFATLGAMSLEQGVAFENVVDGGPGLSFVVFPYGLSRLPHAAIFSTVFFVALLTLGIDSAFSIVEACLASVCDSKPKWPRKYVLPGICAVGALMGLVFTCRRGGLNWLGLTDGLINGPFGILIVALAECIVVGWAWKGTFVMEMQKHTNERSDWKVYGWWNVIVKYIAPALLSILIVWSISEEVDSYRRARTDVSVVYQELVARMDQLAEVGPVFEGEIIDIKITMAHLEDSGAVGKHPLPVHMIWGSIIFVLIPVAAWFISKGRREEQDTGIVRSARRGIIFSGVIMLISAVVINTGLSRGWFTGKAPVLLPDQQLSGTAYIILSVALVVIFGGLVWCFWKAVQAAGGGDTDIPETND